MNQNRFKIRIWNIEKKFMHYNVTMPQNFMIKNEHGEDVFDTDKFIPMQCTGFKDKNGKLIYEGDLVYSIDIIMGEQLEQVFHIGFEAVLGLIDLWKFQPQHIDYSTIGITNHETLEIISNVYERPDLLLDSSKYKNDNKDSE